jgi:hypothetical protein
MLQLLLAKLLGFWHNVAKSVSCTNRKDKKMKLKFVVCMLMLALPTFAVDPVFTDAVLAAPGGARKGFENQPANGLFFVTKAEAKAMADKLASDGIVDSASSVTITDEPWTIGPVIYGSDGRRVLVLNFVGRDGERYAIWAGILFHWAVTEYSIYVTPLDKQRHPPCKFFAADGNVVCR